MPDLTIHLARPQGTSGDWMATIAGEDENGSVGFGSTAAEALRSLADDLEARDA